MTWEDIQNLSLDRWRGDDAKEIDKHLEQIGDVDTREPDYSFDIIRVWVRKETGTILWAFDSGCSCPAPFEDAKVSDLLELPASSERVIELLDDVSLGRPVALVRRELLGVVRRAEEFIADAH